MSRRVTGITTYLEHGGTLEHAQQIAAHELLRTTKLYDQPNDQISTRLSTSRPNRSLG